MNEDSSPSEDGLADGFASDLAEVMESPRKRAMRKLIAGALSGYVLFDNAPGSDFGAITDHNVSK